VDSTPTAVPSTAETARTSTSFTIFEGTSEIQRMIIGAAVQALTCGNNVLRAAGAQASAAAAPVLWLRGSSLFPLRRRARGRRR
jgi:hypothetical protein